MNATLWYKDKRIDVASVEELRAAPDVGVVCIVYRYQRDDGLGMGATIMQNAEWYWYVEGEGFGKSKGVDAATAELPPIGAIAKRAPADMLPVEQYEAIVDAAMAEG